MTPEELYKGQRSILVLVIGMSGTGKSSSLMNLDPKQTFILNVMGKPLPFHSGFTEYKVGDNMVIAPDATTIISELNRFSAVDYRPQVRNVVIDDTQYIMATEFMQKVMVKGYDKFSIMAKNIWDILVLSSRLRGGLRVFVLAHEEATASERKMKTLGKLLDEKLTPEGLSTIVLFSGVSSGSDGNKYFFQTQHDGMANAKSPMGMFPSVIPNDLKLVGDRIDEYYAGVKLEATKLKFEEIVIKKGGYNG
jgi:hypothetical protein